MKKKMIVLALALMMLMAAISPVFAVDFYSSHNLASATAFAYQGSGSGEIGYNYDVKSAWKQDTIGVENIYVYYTNGVKFRTIFGSTTNGLMTTSSYKHSGTFVSRLLPDTSFYSIVKVSASDSSGYDSLSIQTSVIKTKP